MPLIANGLLLCEYQLRAFATLERKRKPDRPNFRNNFGGNVTMDRENKLTNS